MVLARGAIRRYLRVADLSRANEKCSFAFRKTPLVAAGNRYNAAVWCKRIHFAQEFLT